MISEFRARFTAVERVWEYANEVEQEASFDSPPSRKPAKDWPRNGKIEFEKVDFGYNTTTQMVLNKINLTIESGTKLGIVGRTGAGKTSLLSALLRLNELKGGRILIDGLDVSQIGLTDLRSTIAVIPQDPVLFQGTLRHNLDPFNQYNDQQLWSALEKSHLKSTISGNGNGQDKGLMMKVDAEGDNFSVGEKQLICLSRALLRGNKILLLDEPTASVDVKTDSLIQSTIKEEFNDCTVMVIAHRLHTVMDFDKILVMHKGEVAEYGAPEDLLKKQKGIFKSMLKASQASNT